ncbi:MAG: FAD-dependent monooxygenase [Gammaproteobacteria bacterium]|nr:FAD-dependent monooxygenase [Gammaproteobacteria bacterium]
MNTSYDMVICGGGLVGATLGLSLAHLPLSIAIIDPTPSSHRATRTDDRTFTLSLGTKRALTTLGVWPLIPAASINAIRRIHVSDTRGGFGFTHLDAGEIGVEALGYVTESGALWDALRAALARTPITLITGTVRAALRRDGRHDITVDCAQGPQTLTARLLVGADGTASAVRALAGITVLRRSYGREALVVNCGVTRPQRDTAFERFGAEGPLAALPTGRNQYTMVISQRRADDLLALADTDFLKRLQALFGERLGTFTSAGRRLSFPLALVRARTPVGDGVVLVGNAAQTLHPVAGQGFNLGLRDAAALADHVARAVKRGLAIDSPAVLAAYARARGTDTGSTMAFTDRLVRIFAVDGGLAATARNVALTLIDCLPGAKQGLARQTMGLKGPVASILRGVRP